MDAEAGEAGRQRSPAAPFVRSSSRLGAAQSFDGALRELKDLRFGGGLLREGVPRHRAEEADPGQHEELHLRCGCDGD